MGLGLGDPVVNVPERITVPPLLIQIGVPAVTTGTFGLSRDSTRNSPKPLFTINCPRLTPATVTVKAVPEGRLTELTKTRILRFVLLWCSEYSPKPLGTPPLIGAPESCANMPPGLGDGEGEPVGLGDGEPVGVPVGLGLGDPVGVPVGEGLGEPVGVPVGLGEPVGVPVGLPVGEGDPVGLPVGEAEGEGEPVVTPKTPERTV